VVDLKIVARIAVVGVRHAAPCTATAIFVAVICFGCGRSQPATQPPGQSSASAPAAQPAPDTARLIRELTSPDVYTRRNAAQDLASLGPAAETASPALINALSDKDDEVCVWALRALSGIGPASASAVPAILGMMTARGGYIGERCALTAIGDIEKIGPTAVAPLVAALATPDGEKATVLLERLGEPAAAALARTLAEGGARTEAAAIALERLGPRAAPAVPALLDAWRARKIDPQLFLNIVRRIGEPATMALVAALDDQDLGVRNAAVEALGRIGPSASAAVVAITRARDRGAVDRALANDAIKGIAVEK